MVKNDLTGRRAIVCGGSQGIGFAVAVQLAHMGAQVTLLARDYKKLDLSLRQLPSNHGQQHQIVVADFSKTSSLPEALAWMNFPGLNNTAG